MTIPGPFDFVKALSTTKDDLIRGHADPEAAEKAYNAFLTNRAMSYHNDAVLYANEMNCAPHLDPIMQHDFYLHGLRSKKRFSEWPKPNRGDALNAVMRFFGYGRSKAVEAMLILTDDEVESIVRAIEATEEPKEKKK